MVKKPWRKSLEKHLNKILANIKIKNPAAYCATSGFFFFKEGRFYML